MCTKDYIKWKGLLPNTLLHITSHLYMLYLQMHCIYSFVIGVWLNIITYQVILLKLINKLKMINDGSVLLCSDY